VAHVRLGAIATILSGLPTYRLRGEAGPAVPLLKVGDLNHVHNPDWKLQSIQVPEASRVLPYRVHANDIVVTARGTSLKIALVPERWDGAILAWNLLGIRIGSQLRPEILLAYLRSRVGRQAIDRRLAGATMLLLTAEGLKDLEVPLPALDCQEKLVHLLRAAERQYEEALRVADLRRRIAQKLVFEGMMGRIDQETDA
jgi:type I restriction enzyme M protein